MAEVKIKHGLAFYLDESGDRPVQRTAFRTQVIDVSEKEAARLIGLGAAVDKDEELPRNGVLTPIPNTASDEELIAWVSVATKDEIAQAISERPQLKDRLLTAHDIITSRLEAQQELLGGLKDTIKEGERRAKKRKASQSAPTTGQGGAHTVFDAANQSGEGDGDDDGEEEELDEDDPREVVKGNVTDVSKWLAEHPDQCDAVLQAETEARNGQPRPGVVASVKAIAENKSQ